VPRKRKLSKPAQRVFEIEVKVFQRDDCKRIYDRAIVNIGQVQYVIKTEKQKQKLFAEMQRFGVPKKQMNEVERQFLALRLRYGSATTFNT